MKSKRFFFISLALLLLSSVPAFSAQKLVSIGTGGTGGSSYYLGGIICNLWNKYIPDFRSTPEVTMGSVDNTKLIVDGKTNVGAIITSILMDAKNGVDKWKGTRYVGLPHVKTLFLEVFSAVQFVALEGSGINSLRDTVGKRISFGPPGGGQKDLAEETYSAMGINPYKQAKVMFLSHSEGASALKNRQIDGVFFSGAPPMAAISDLFATPGIHVKLVPIEQETLTRLNEKNFTLVPVTLPKGTYSGQTSDVRTFGIEMYIVVNDEKIDENLAYQLTKTIAEHVPELQAGTDGFKLFRKDAMYNDTWDKKGVPFHPGALKYYKEAKLIR